jgi:5'-3' exonuclease
MQTIRVSFSPCGTVNSTLTSLVSLARQIPKIAARVAGVNYEDRWLTISLEEGEGDTDYTVTHNQPSFSVSLENLSTSGLKKAIAAFCNRLSSDQIKRGGICDVNELKVEDGIFSLDSFPSEFQARYSATIPETLPPANPASSGALSVDEVLSSNNRLLLIDMSNLVSACYYATAYGVDEEKLMKSPSGLFTNAIKPMMERFVKIIRKFACTHVAVTIDEKRELTWRRVLYDSYKRPRDEKEKPQSLTEQFQTAMDLFSAMEIPMIKVDEMEADDIIGTLSKLWVENNKGDVIILSNDKDLYQLLGDKVTQVITKDEEITPKFLDDNYGVKPEQWADCKAIIGELGGDNYPGVPGVGKETAYKLIKQYGSLGGVFENLENLDPSFNRFVKKLKEGKESGELCLKLATLVTDITALKDINLDSLKLQVNKQGMREKLEELAITLSSKKDQV